MMRDVVFDPLIAMPILWLAAALVAGLLLFAALRGLTGRIWRGVALIGLLVALANPSLQTEQTTPLSDIVLALLDETSSQRLDVREAQSQKALADIERQIARMPNTELRTLRVRDAKDNQGSQVMRALVDALSDIPAGRLAGVIIVTDGQIHDAAIGPQLPAPLNVLLTGTPRDWDRRLIVENAPAFAILDEEVTLTLRVEDQGAVPADMPTTTPILISVDGAQAQSYTIPVGKPVTVPLILPHGGMNVIHFTVPEVSGELTTRNNSAVIKINGVRDRLRVLLVSGEPHNGERTWRNLLKSDASVDLVHFTILRPPTKQDGVPVTELSLIAFPTRELFMEKVDEFDLIIFDRYKLRGILPSAYLDNIARYVEDGGAVLISAGPDFASADSLYRSPMSRVIPVVPTGRVIEEGYKPRVSRDGLRHPITQDLGGSEGEDVAPDWGRWFRQIDVEPISGAVLMEGVEDRALLVVDRVGEGRVAVLASDHAWLWTRGIEGGGPQLELLRRLAHWMMKEPELEEESLTATADGTRIIVTKRTLDTEVEDVTIQAPDGTQTTVELSQVSPGKFEGQLDTNEDIGLYRLDDGTMSAVVVVGPAAPREFEETIATDRKIKDTLKATRGGSLALSDGSFSIRRVAQGRPAAGRGWIGVTPRNAFVSDAVTRRPMLPTWGWLLLIASMSVLAWLREGRRQP